MIDDPNKMIFRGIKVDFLDKELNSSSPLYSIVYDHQGFIHQGYYSSNILTICRYLISHFGMTENDVFIALKPVADAINEACEELRKG